MQVYDFLMLAILGGCVLFGFWKGFAWQIASIASIVVSYLVARNFSGPVAEMIGADPVWSRFLAMFILFFGCAFAIWIVFGFVRSTIDRLHLRTFDRQVGGALGLVKGVLLCIIITLFSVSLLGDNVRQAVCTSTSGNYVSRILAELRGVVPTEIRTYVGPYVDRFNQEMEEHRSGTPGSDDPQARPPLHNIFPGNSAPSTSTEPKWTPPSDGIQGGSQESLGTLVPGGLDSTARTWEGHLQRIDWSRAGQTVDQYLNHSKRR